MSTLHCFFKLISIFFLVRYFFLLNVQKRLLNFISNIIICSCPRRGSGRGCVRAVRRVRDRRLSLEEIQEPLQSEVGGNVIGKIYKNKESK